MGKYLELFQKLFVPQDKEFGPGDVIRAYSFLKQWMQMKLLLRAM